MSEMTLSSIHRIRNSNPGCLRPSTLPFGLCQHFVLFQTAVTGKRAPNSSVKGSGANHYPRAPAHQVLCTLKSKYFCQKLLVLYITCSTVMYTGEATSSPLLLSDHSQLYAQVTVDNFVINNTKVSKLFFDVHLVTKNETRHICQ